MTLEVFTKLHPNASVPDRIDAMMAKLPQPDSCFHEDDKREPWRNYVFGESKDNLRQNSLPCGNSVIEIA